MTESFAGESGRGVFDENGEWVGGMFGGIGCERKQGFHFRGYVNPGTHAGAGMTAPGFGGECNLERVEEREIDEVREKAVARVNPVNDTRQASNDLRGRFRLLFQRRAEFLQLRRGK